MAATATAAGGGTSVARPRSADVLGVVILDAGKRSAAADDMLLSVASVYGRMTRREVIAVANSATLEAAVRGCMEDGATKVMVVPYCTSLEFQPDANPALALADVQARLPGIRCMMGETISVSTMLAEVIESQVKVVDGRRPDVAERWFTPEPRAMNRSTWSDWQHTQQSTAGAAGAAGAQQHQQAEAAQPAHAAASHSADAGVNGSSPAPRAWSDDFSNVMVVDYRPKPQQPAESAATSTAGANGQVNGAAANGAAVNGTVVNGAAVNGHVNGAVVIDTAASSAAVNGTAANGHAAGAINSTVPSSSSGGGAGTANGSRFADWAGVGGSLDGSSGGSEQDVPFADWAGDGSQPVYEEVLDARLTGIEDQLSRIAGLLEMMPKGQQAAALQLQQDGQQANSAVPLQLSASRPKKPFLLRFLQGEP